MAQSVYCLFCATGKESVVETLLEKLGFHVISAAAERFICKKKKRIKVRRRIIPGYVFFASEETPDWGKIIGAKYVFYPLEYGDGTRALHGEDLNFIHWLLNRRCVIPISAAIKEGTKIRILEGPLKEYEGKILKINTRQRCAEIKINGEQIVNTIWLSFDIVETIEKK
jgi:transcriptional antiterminator NusG